MGWLEHVLARKPLEPLRLPILVMLAVPAATACTPGYQWIHPEYTDDQRSSDQRLCERKAEAQAPIAYRKVGPEQTYARHRPSSDYLGPNCGHSCANKRASSFNQDQRRRSTPRIESYRVVDDRVTADCMRALGYAYRRIEGEQGR